MEEGTFSQDNAEVEMSHSDSLAQRLQVGSEFYSYQEFQEVLSQYQQENHVMFCAKGSKKIKFEPTMMEKFLYEFLQMECKQGKIRESRCQGIRPNQTTLKVGCKATIVLSLKQRKDGVFVLRIRRSILDHNNHPVSKENAFRYPEMRRIEVNETIKDMMTSQDVNVREIRDYIKQQQDREVTTKDINKIKRKLCLEEGIVLPRFTRSPPVPKKKIKIEKPSTPRTPRGLFSSVEERSEALEPLLLKGWALCPDRDALHKEFLFSSFNEAFRFISGIALESNKMDHYLEWHNKKSRVVIILESETKSGAGITWKDIRLGNFIESLAV